MSATQMQDTTIALLRREVPRADEGRIQRAAALIAAEAIRQGPSDTTWFVRSSDNHSEYVVFGTAFGLCCTCPDAARGTFYCKHALSVIGWQAMAGAVAPPPERPVCRECGQAAARIGCEGRCTSCLNREIYGDVA